METIQIIERGFTLSDGFILGLSEEQALKRGYCLNSVGDGKYQTTKKVSFKVGEIISVENIDLLGKGIFKMISKPNCKESIAEERIKAKNTNKEKVKKAK